MKENLIKSSLHEIEDCKENEPRILSERYFTYV